MKPRRTCFVVDKNGTLAYDGAIDNKPDPQHDPRTARNYVREAVDALLAGKPVEVSQTSHTVAASSTRIKLLLRKQCQGVGALNRRLFL